LAIAGRVLELRKQAGTAEERLNALLSMPLGEVDPEEIDEAIKEARIEFQNAIQRQFVTGGPIQETEFLPEPPPRLGNARPIGMRHRGRNPSKNSCTVRPSR
jgi:hypothetical protein